MLSCILSIAIASPTWYLVENDCYELLSTQQDLAYTQINFKGSNANVMSWTKTLTHPDKVTGSTNNNPPWTSNYSPHNNNGTISLSVAGPTAAFQTLPSNSRYEAIVEWDKYQGQEVWTNGSITLTRNREKWVYNNWFERITPMGP